MKLTIVDVFAETPLAGNQLAVVEEVGSLGDAGMQAIAREMNFSETTFVTRRADDRADVRIFTPDAELPFAGHPTLGTAWVLSGGVGTLTLDLAAGAVPVRFEDGLGWMQPPPVTLGADLDPGRAAALLGLQPAALDPAYPVRFAEVGPQFLLIGLRRLENLRHIRFDAVLHARMLAEGLGVQCVFVFTPEAYGPDADFASRMFFDAGGIREDPATGSANVAFAAYLRGLGRGGDVVVDQGVEMRRPSRLYLRIGEAIEVGGRVHAVATGTFAPLGPLG